MFEPRMTNKKSKPKSSKIDKFRETLSTKKEDRKIPVGVPVQLAIHEARIENCIQQDKSIWLEIGKTLLAIQQQKEFPEKTFKAYIQRRWKRTRSWAYQIIEGYETVLALPKNVQPVVQNQKQALAIGKAEPEKRAAILKEAEKQGDTSPKKIFSLIEVGADKIEREKSEPKVEADFRVIVKDANGEDVPEEIEKDFQLAEEESKKQINSAQAIKNFLSTDEALNVEARGLRETAKDLLAGLKTHLSKHVLCPKCKGKKCAICSKRGFVSNHFATKGIGNK